VIKSYGVLRCSDVYPVSDLTKSCEYLRRRVWDLWSETLYDVFYSGYWHCGISGVFVLRNYVALALRISGIVGLVDLLSYETTLSDALRISGTSCPGKWRWAVPRNRSCLTNDEMLGLIARSLGMELSERKQRNCAFCGVRIADVQSVRDESYVYSTSQGVWSAL